MAQQHALRGWGCVAGLVGALLAPAAAAQDFTLGAGFTPDPQIGTGWSGGPNQASRFGSQCVGSIAQQPDHHINVTSAVNLRLAVESDIDSTLVVMGPAGVFCDDDSGDRLNARIDARLTPGQYAVYVGNYSEPGAYRLVLTENMSARADTGSRRLHGDSSDGADQGRYGSFRLGAGFLPDPQTASGFTGGGVYASQQFGGHCAGMINDAPDHTLNITSRVSLDISVRSGTDSTLVIAGPGKVVCDDDGNPASRLDARIVDTFQPGEYGIYVGHIGSGADYTLTIRESFDP